MLLPLFPLRFNLPTYTHLVDKSVKTERMSVIDRKSAETLFLNLRIWRSSISSRALKSPASIAESEGSRPLSSRRDGRFQFPLWARLFCVPLLTDPLGTITFHNNLQTSTAKIALAGHFVNFIGTRGYCSIGNNGILPNFGWKWLAPI